MLDYKGEKLTLQESVRVRLNLRKNSQINQLTGASQTVVAVEREN